MPKRINGGKMKKILISVTVLGALVACTEPQPEQDQYFDHITPVPNQITGEPIPPVQPIPAQPIPAGTTPSETIPVDPNTNVDADGISYETVTVNAGDIVPPAATTTAAPAPGLYEPALAAPTETTKSKKRTARPIKPVALKPRSKSLNLREYSATQTHLVGEKVYTRSASKYSNGGNCDQYSIPEIAQIAFLNAGGPRKDSLLLDGDGDGFACAWVPQR
jgi:hypothetical protein